MYMLTSEDIKIILDDANKNEPICRSCGKTTNYYVYTTVDGVNYLKCNTDGCQKKIKINIENSSQNKNWEEQMINDYTIKKLEQVNNPAHYGGANNPYEAIKVIEAWNLGFCLGNTVKYISRNGKKQGEESLKDLKKARWYLDRVINSLENK